MGRYKYIAKKKFTFKCPKCGTEVHIAINKRNKLGIVSCVCGINEKIENIPSIYEKVDVFGDFIDIFFADRKPSKGTKFKDLDKGFLEFD